MILGALAPDLIAPSGSITNPLSGSTKAGTITPTITATDDHGVAGVQWKVDGVNFGAEKTVAPFSASALDTTVYDDAISHSISAIVRDVVNHLTTVSLNFNINNNPGGGAFGTIDPARGGRRSYDHLGSFSNPQYIDGTGWSWGGNAFSSHYKVQMRYIMTPNDLGQGFEAINGPQSVPNHVYSLDIGGVDCHEKGNDNAGTTDSGWFDVSDARSGTIQFRDWVDPAYGGVGGTAYVGWVTLYYQYVWIH